MTPLQEPNQSNKKRISLAKYIISILIVAILASGTTMFIYESKHSSGTLGLGSGDADLSELTYLNQLIQSQYIKEVDQQDLIDGAMKGMIGAMGDPYSDYFVPVEAKDFDDSVAGSFEGIGAVMKIENDYPTVAEPPIKGSPAEKAKLQAGDVFIKVDGKKTEGRPLQEVVKDVRGEKGTTVTIDIIRGDSSFPVEIVRDTIPVESVKGNIDAKNKSVGYIQIISFNETTTDEFNDKVTALREQGAKSFIIDVRGNPGGVLGVVERITSRFLEDDQTIVSFEARGKKEVSKEVASKELDNGDKIKEPTVLLVDGNSASASEIMAGAFVESAGLDVVGVKTFGKGTVQTLIPVPSGGEVKLTISKWLTPDGHWIHEKGVKPTVEVDYPEYMKTTVLDRSLTYQLGVVNKNVETIHLYLEVLGYGGDKNSDIYSEETVESVRAFQKDHDLKETGVVDKETAYSLEEAIYNHWKANDVQYNKALELLEKK